VSYTWRKRERDNFLHVIAGEASSRDQAEVGLSNLAERVRHDLASCSEALQKREQTPELQQEQMAALHKAIIYI
jgi:hypothetical protein